VTRFYIEYYDGSIYENVVNMNADRNLMM